MQTGNSIRTEYRTAHKLAAALVFLMLTGAPGFGAHGQGLGGNGNGLLSQPRFLPVDEAFSFYTSLPEPGVVVVHWTIADDYYLYREKFGFAFGVNAAHRTTADLPAGVAHHDEFFGDVEVYYGQVAARLQMPQHDRADPLLLIIEYQGCSELGLCYPPQTREIELNL